MARVRIHGLGLLVVLASTGLAQGQDWVRRCSRPPATISAMWRAARVEYDFKFHNPYKEDAHIVDVPVELWLHDAPRVERHAQDL